MINEINDFLSQNETFLVFDELQQLFINKFVRKGHSVPNICCMGHCLQRYPLILLFVFEPVSFICFKNKNYKKKVLVKK